MGQARGPSVGMARGGQTRGLGQTRVPGAAATCPIISMCYIYIHISMYKNGRRGGAGLKIVL